MSSSSSSSFFSSSHDSQCLYIFFILDIGFEVPDAFLVGYALDYNEYFRDLSVSFLHLITSDDDKDRLVII